MPLLKFTAYWFTRSSASSLRLSLKPADASHRYGHLKISFFSAGVEGALIAIAALFIIYSAVPVG